MRVVIAASELFLNFRELGNHVVGFSFGFSVSCGRIEIRAGRKKVPVKWPRNSVPCLPSAGASQPPNGSASGSSPGRRGGPGRRRRGPLQAILRRGGNQHRNSANEISLWRITMQASVFLPTRSLPGAMTSCSDYRRHSCPIRMCSWQPARRYKNAKSPCSPLRCSSV
jgi:hypothetical protein